jgi:hypothetical protein
MLNSGAPPGLERLTAEGRVNGDVIVLFRKPLKITKQTALIHNLIRIDSFIL